MKSYRQTRQRILLAVLLGCTSVKAYGQSGPSSFTWGTRYDLMGRVVGTIAPDPDGTGPLHYAAVRDTYDAQGRLTRVETGELSSWQSEATAPSAWSGFSVSSKVETSYDPMNRKTVDANWGWDNTTSAWVESSLTQYSYDGVGRLQCTAVRMNAAFWGALPASACTPTTTSPTYGDDRITKNVYDAAGQLIQVRSGVGTIIEQADVTYSYTPNGKQEYVIDGNGNRAQLTYDGVDRKAAWYFSSPTGPTGFDGSTQATALATAGAVSTTDYEAYGYDPNSNITSRRLRNSTPSNLVQIIYTYDALNRLQNKTLPTGNPNLSSAYAYDLLGHLTSMTSSNASNVYSTATTYIYDAFGRKTSETEKLNGTLHTTSSDYDADGNRIKLTWDGAFYVTYVYDGIDRMTDITESGTTNLIHLDYDSAGRRQKLSRANGNGMTTEYGYDSISRLNDLKLKTGATVVNDYGFNYTPASQVSQKTLSNDAFAWTGATAVNRSYTPNGLNQYGPITGITTPTYDPKGNLTSAGGATYAYNAENELATQGSYRFYYDPTHRLLYSAQAGIWLESDGDKLAAEYDNSGTILLRRYVFGPGVDEPLIWYEGSGTADKRWLVADAQGSIVSVTNGSGSTLAINSYDEYGVPSWTNDTYAGRFRYTGQQWISELGMYYYKARIYSPTLGRFLQADPIGYGDQVNLYAYVANDPVNHADPTGLYDVSAADAAKVKSIIATAKEAANTRPTGSLLPSSAGRQLGKVLNDLGTANDHNGIKIALAPLDSSTAGVTSADGNSITIGVGGSARDEIINGAITIAHEATHSYLDRHMGVAPTMHEYLLRERTAYSVESVVAEHYNYSTNTWHPGISPQEYDKNRVNSAYASCLQATLESNPYAPSSCHE